MEMEPKKCECCVCLTEQVSTLVMENPAFKLEAKPNSLKRQWILLDFTVKHKSRLPNANTLNNDTEQQTKIYSKK